VKKIANYKARERRFVTELRSAPVTESLLSAAAFDVRPPHCEFELTAETRALIWRAIFAEKDVTGRLRLSEHPPGRRRRALFKSPLSGYG
jgi:hypothetical protein